MGISIASWRSDNNLILNEKGVVCTAPFLRYHAQRETYKEFFNSLSISSIVGKLLLNSSGKSFVN